MAFRRSKSLRRNPASMSFRPLERVTLILFCLQQCVRSSCASFAGRTEVDALRILPMHETKVSLKDNGAGRGESDRLL